MKQLKKFLSGFLAACLVAGLLPWMASAAAATLTVGDGQTYANLDAALAAANDGDTIQLVGSVLANDKESDSAPLVIDKAITITGDTLNLRSGGIVLSADVTFRDVTLSFANRVRNAIIANGYTLTLDNVSRDSSGCEIHLFCGGITGLPGILQAGPNGVIVIEGNTSLGNIYAGSISSDGANNNSNIPATIQIAENGPSMGDIYACGALQTPVNPDEMLNPGYHVAPPAASAENYQVSANVTIELYNSTAKSVDGETGGTTDATVLFHGDGDLAALSLSNLSSLTVESGYLQPKVLSFSGNNAAVTVDASARLDLSELDDLTIDAFTGNGGELVLGELQTLTISGAVTGTTMVGIGSLSNNGESGVVTQNRTYIIAPDSTDSSFSFTPASSTEQSSGRLTRDESGNWSTTGFPTENDFVKVESLDLLDKVVVYDGQSENGIISMPFLLTPEDPSLYLEEIPFQIAVNNIQASSNDDGYEIPKENIFLFVDSDNNLNIHSSGFQMVPVGTYAIVVTVPAEYTTINTEITCTATLTVTDLSPIAIPKAITDLKANGSEQIGVPEGIGYTLSGIFKATNAGTYTAIATLDAGYCWSDGSTEPVNITWNIAEADAVDPPSAPTGLTGVAPTSENGNGKIDGTTADMEYADSADAVTWTACTAGSTEVSPGTYYVRFQATANTPASNTATVTVPEYGGSVTPPVETVTSIQVITQEGYSPIAVGTQLSEVLGKLSLQVTYSTNRNQIIPVTADMINGFDSSKPQKITLQISYEGQTAALEIEVVETVTPPDPDAKYAVTVDGSYAATSGEGSYSEGDTVTINAGTRDGYTFSGWSGSDDVVFASASSASTTFTMPAHDVTVTANWTQTVTPPDPDAKYAVTVNDSYAAASGEGSYSESDTVTINAGTRDGYAFSGWSSSSDDVVFANASSASTTFTMPAHDVTVTANWTQAVTPPDPDAKYTVTVNGSFATTSGAGSYSAGDTVTLDAGTREGYTFTSWSGPDSVALADPLNPQTTFPMPAQDVTITANWVENTEPSPEVYTVTVNGSYADRSGAGNYPAGAEVVIDAGSLSGYSFAGWTSTDVLQFLNAGNFRTSFTMPAANVSVTANWRRNSTGSSTGGSSSGGAGASDGTGGSGSSSGSSSRKDKDDDTSSSVKTSDQSLSERISAAPLGSTVNMTLTTGDAKVGKTVFSTLAGKNTSLEIQTGSVIWKINGLELSRTASYRDVDLGVSVNAGTIPQSALASLPGGSQIMQLALAQEGSYGMRLHLTVDTGIGNAGQWANFYAYSPLSGTMQFRYASQIAQDGTASLPVSQAEDYAVVVSPVNHTPAAGSAQGQSGASFSDVAPGAWYSAAVAYASQKGLMSGSGNGSFSPEATTTRSQLVSILYRLAGSPAVSGTLPFPDTSADAYYADAVLWATQSNIVGGYANGSFGPSDPVTTEQLCTFLSRYAQLKGLSVSAQAEQLAGFSDRGQVSSYAADPVAWAVSRGIVSGSGSGHLMPKKQTSRAQAAVILMQFCENVL